MHQFLDKFAEIASTSYDDEDKKEFQEYIKEKLSEKHDDDMLTLINNENEKWRSEREIAAFKAVCYRKMKCDKIAKNFHEIVDIDINKFETLNQIMDNDFENLYLEKENSVDYKLMENMVQSLLNTLKNVEVMQSENEAAAIKHFDLL